MHLSIATMGDEFLTRRFIEGIRNMSVHAPVPNQMKTIAKVANMRPVSQIMKVQVREWKFFDVVFPQESLDIILNSISPFSSPDSRQEKAFNMLMKPVRSLIGYEEVPWRRYRDTKPSIIKEGIIYQTIPHPGVRIVPIGIKRDYISKSQGCEAL